MLCISIHLLSILVFIFTGLHTSWSWEIKSTRYQRPHYDLLPAWNVTGYIMADDLQDFVEQVNHWSLLTWVCGNNVNFFLALLVAARLHNFNRTIKEVSKVVKVNQATIRNRYSLDTISGLSMVFLFFRLCDFKDTPSSRLTIEDFLQINLEQEHDPPSYSEARKKPKLATNNEPEVTIWFWTPLKMS